VGDSRWSSTPRTGPFDLARRNDGEPKSTGTAMQCYGVGKSAKGGSHSRYARYLGFRCVGFPAHCEGPDDRIPNQPFHFCLGAGYNDKWIGHHTRPPRLELRNNSASHRPNACTILKHVDNIRLIQQGLEWNLACTIDKRGPFNQ
jgi:hypothetical protein